MKVFVCLRADINVGVDKIHLGKENGDVGGFGIENFGEETAYVTPKLHRIGVCVCVCVCCTASLIPL